jgi:hypothetical protein
MVQRSSVLFSDARGKSCDLKIFMSQGKRSVARKSLAAISAVAARFYAFPNSSPIWWTATNRLGFERNHFSISRQWNVFGGPHESFIQGLYFVVATVRWKTNYENSGRFVAAHFLAAHILHSCLHPSGSHFSFKPSIILYNPEGIVLNALTS